MNKESKPITHVPLHQAARNVRSTRFGHTGGDFGVEVGDEFFVDIADDENARVNAATFSCGCPACLVYLLDFSAVLFCAARRSSLSSACPSGSSKPQGKAAFEFRPPSPRLPRTDRGTRAVSRLLSATSFTS